MDTVRELFDDRTFQAAVAYGGIAFVVVTLVGATRAWGRRPPLGGIGFTAAALAALAGLGPAERVGDLPDTLLVGLAVLALTGFGLQFVKVPLFVPMVAFLPGAWLVGLAVADIEPAWVQPFVVVLTAVVSALAGDVDHYQRRRGLGPVMLVVTVIGVYATVPDTEHALVLVGAALPLAFLGVPTAIATLGGAGAAVSTALTLWVAAVDGVGRPSSIIGAGGAFGLLAAEPLGRRLFWRLRRRQKQGTQTLTRHLVVVADAILLHAVCVVWSARVVGRTDSVTTAALLLVPMVVLAIAVGGTFPPAPRPRRGGLRRRRTMTVRR